MIGSWYRLGRRISLTIRNQGSALNLLDVGRLSKWPARLPFFTSNIIFLISFFRISSYEQSYNVGPKKVPNSFEIQSQKLSFELVNGAKFKISKSRDLIGQEFLIFFSNILKTLRLASIFLKTRLLQDLMNLIHPLPPACKIFRNTSNLVLDWKPILP